MKETVVDIVLQGLIALVPIMGVDGVEMQALLVDSEVAWAGASETVKTSRPFEFCHAKHEPKITIRPVEQVSCPPKPRCEWDASVCECSLSRDDITFSPSATKRSMYGVPAGPARALPHSLKDEEGGSFAYVPNLSQMATPLNLATLAPTPPRVVASRLRFGYDSLASCDLATRKDDMSDHVHAFTFRGVIKERSSSKDPVQAGAQQVAIQSTIRFDEEAPAVILRPMDGGEPLRIPLDIKSKKDVKIKVMNHRPPTKPGDPCDDGIGRDFAMYYELTEAPGDWAGRRIPHVKYTQWKSFRDVDPQACGPAPRGVNARPICMMTRFDPVRESEQGEE